MPRLTFTIHGLVQGVNFRASVCDFAHTLLITGYIKNLPDGTVRVVAEGEKEKLRKLLDFCYNKVVGARVRKIDAEWEKGTGEFEGFEVRD